MKKRILSILLALTLCLSLLPTAALATTSALTEIDFGSQTIGYGAITSQTVGVHNTGTGATGELTVTLTGDTTAFTLSNTRIESIAAGNSKTFTVTPATGLAVGTYSATVTVSGSNDITVTVGGSNDITASFTVKFAVTALGDDITAVTFPYAYDAQRNPPFPASGVTVSLTDITTPLNASSSHLSTSSGQWKLTTLGIYGEFSSPSENLTGVVGKAAAAYKIADKTALPVYELKENDTHIAYGVLVAYDKTSGCALFLGDNWNNGGAGYLLSMNQISGKTASITAAQVVSEQVSTYSVAITAGAHMTTTGSATQNVTKTESMTDVTYTAADGYYFPANYAVAESSGITVTRLSDTQIKVSGAPTANVALTLADATVQQYTITFDTKGGSTVAPITQDYGSAITAPAAPTRTGYTFAGWDNDIPDTMPANALTLTAQWNAVTYSISYDLNGGTATNPTTYTIESAAITLANPTRAGYRFLGWTGSNGDTAQTSVTIAKGSTGDKTYTANWQFIPVVSLPVSNVNVSSGLNGSAEADRDQARQGSIVTVTVAPSAGHALDALTVTDAKGNALTVTHVSGNKYSFIMPDGDVTVRATFTDGLNTGFVDVPASKYFYDAVNWAVANGITSGTDATHFSPYASCTRGQLVTFLWRAAGQPAAKATENPFSDVKEGSAFYKAILWAAENGIVTGYSDGTFRPNNPVTRQQSAAILWRYAKYAGMDVSVGEDTNILSFDDALDIAEYAFPALQWAVGEGIMQGSHGNLLPRSTCTRAQIVTMLYRLLTE